MQRVLDLSKKLETSPDLHARVGDEKALLLIREHAKQARRLCADLKEEIGKAGQDEKAGLRTTLDQAEDLAACFRVTMIAIETMLLWKSGEQCEGTADWAPRHAFELREHLPYLEQRLDEYPREEDSSSYLDKAFLGMDRAARWMSSTLASVGNNPREEAGTRTRSLLREVLPQYTRMEDLRLEASELHRFLARRERGADDATQRLESARAELITAAQSGMMAAHFSVRHAHIMLHDSLASFGAGFDQAKARSAIAASLLLRGEMEQVVAGLMPAYERGGATPPVSELLALDRKIEVLAEKCKAMEEFFDAGNQVRSDVAAERKEAPYAIAGERVLKLRNYVRLKLEQSGYQPPALATETSAPKRSAQQQKLMDSLGASEDATSGAQAESKRKNKKTKRAPEETERTTSQQERTSSEIAPEEAASVVEEEDEIDVAYFPHLLKNASAREIESTRKRLEQTVEYEEKRLEEIASSLQKPAYNLARLGTISTSALFEAVTEENQQLACHEVRTATSISSYRQLMARATPQEKAQLQAKIKQAQEADRQLQIEVSERQFPNSRAVRILLAAGKLRLEKGAGGSNVGKPTQGEDGEWTAFEAYRLVFNDKPEAGLARTYAEIHAHYKCDQDGNPLFDALGNKLYVERPVFDENGRFERVEKAIHLKHPSQARLGKAHEQLNDEKVHRWPVQVVDFQMMLSYASDRLARLAKNATGFMAGMERNLPTSTHFPTTRVGASLSIR